MKTFKQYVTESNSECGVSKNDLQAKILGLIKNQPTYNQGKPPTNGELYGIDGTPESWAKFYTSLAGHESGYNACKPFKNDINGVPEPGGSGGLFQLGRDQIEIWAKKYPSLASSYGISSNKNYSEQELLNADTNTRGMLFIGDALLREDYSVGPRVGLGRTIGKLIWDKIAQGAPLPAGGTGTMLAKNDADGKTTTSNKSIPADDYESPQAALAGLFKGFEMMGKTMGLGS